MVASVVPYVTNLIQWRCPYGLLDVTVYADYHPSLKASARVLLASIAGLLAIAFVPWLHFEVPVSVNVTLHTTFETVSVVVSALVFSVGWHTFSRQNTNNVALVCSAFLGVAILDFAHLLSFDGMPDFITPSGAGKPIATFLAARVMVAVAIVAIACMPWYQRVERRVHNALLAFSLVFAVAFSAFAMVEPALIPYLFIPGRGLTAFKLGLEYGLIVLNLLAAAGFYLRMRKPQPYPVVQLFTAACLMALSELCFTLYASFEDQYINYGHVLKVMAYVYVYRAIVISMLEAPYRELELARSELAENEEKYRLLFENSLDAYMLTNVDGSVYAANPAACTLFGLTEEQFIRGGRAAVTVADDPRLHALLALRHNTGRARGELTMQRADGTRFEAEISSAVFTDGKGRRTTSTFVRDITVRKKAESDILELNSTLEQRVRDRTTQIEAVNEDLERFAHAIAHDLRSPLVTIEGFTNLLERSTGESMDDKQRHYLKRIRAGAMRMSSMIDALLDYAQYSRATLKIEPLDLSELADRTLALLRRREPSRAVQTSVQKPLPFQGDKRLMALVMENLLDICWKQTAGKAGAEIQVGAEAGDNGETVFFVANNGFGFDTSAASKLFDVFQIINTKTELQTAGISLAQVRLIVGRHGWRIWADSTPGGATTFRIARDVHLAVA